MVPRLHASCVYVHTEDDRANVSLYFDNFLKVHFNREHDTKPDIESKST